MASKLLVGPLLGIESDLLYTICFTTRKTIAKASATVGGQAYGAKIVGQTYDCSFWRVEFPVVVGTGSVTIGYSITLDGVPASDSNDNTEWQFYVPAATEKPRIMYASCNGFSSLGLMNKTEHPYALWEKVAEEHKATPFSLMIMGGDQVYADSMWSAVPTLKEWAKLKRKQKVSNRPVSKEMLQQIDRFYDELYQQRWSNPEMANMFASIPNIMMWDDHDIFDGWGSYPDDLQSGSAVFGAIFSAAKRYFELLQIRSAQNACLLNHNGHHYAFALNFRGYHILAMDHRSERSLSQVMSKEQWDDVLAYLDNVVLSGDLLLLSGVPVVYRDFSFAEGGVDFTPWEEELTDDLKDHWRAKEHQGERARLIMRLLDNVEARQKNGGGRTVILSGDVHIGCLGVVNDSRTSPPRKIHQVVSSGIVHPSPSRIAWHGIMALTNDKPEHLNEDKSIEITMLTPYGSDKYLRTRNYVTLLEGTDKKLWVNWVCESKDKPAYPLE